MSSLPILKKQLDRCDVCGDKIHKQDLVRTQVRFMQPETENKFLYSSYDDSYWTATVAVDSYDSYGLRCDDARYSIAGDNTLSVINGTATWAESAKITSAVTDVSAMDNVCVSAYVGAHQASTSPEMTITMGYAVQGEADVTMVTRTTKGQERVFWTHVVPSLNPVVTTILFWISVTSSGSYWIDNIQLEDSTSPGEFIKTTGTAEEYAVDTPLMTVRKVCPECREELLHLSDVYTGHTAQVSPQIPFESERP